MIDMTAAERAARAVDTLPETSARTLLREIARIAATAPLDDKGAAGAFRRIRGLILGPQDA